MAKEPTAGVETPAGIEQPGGKRNLSKSATRALDVLEYFAMVGRPLRAVEIAQAFEFHTSSADQLLKTMVDSAYLMFDSANKLYYPSPRLVNFGAWLSSNYFGEDRIYRLIRSAHHCTGEIVTLSVRYGSSMQIVDVVAPLDQTGTVAKGLRIPISGSVIGTAFLSAHSDKEVIRILGQANDEAGTRLSVAELRDYLAAAQACRDKGYVSGMAMAAARLWALAMPLPKTTRDITMVLGLAGQESLGHREDELVELLRAAIEQGLAG